MAIKVTQERLNIFTLELAEPELSWVVEVAKSLGMPKVAVVTASFGQGITHYRSMVQRLTPEQYEVGKQANDLDEGTS